MGLSPRWIMGLVISLVLVSMIVSLFGRKENDYINIQQVVTFHSEAWDYCDTMINDETGKDISGKFTFVGKESPVIDLEKTTYEMVNALNEYAINEGLPVSVQLARSYKNDEPEINVLVIMYQTK